MAELVRVSEMPPALMRQLVEHEKDSFGASGLNEWALPVFARHGRVFIYRDGDLILGTAQALRDWDDPGLVFIVGLSIAPRHRGRGLSKSFLEALLGRLRQDGARTVRLTVASDNAAAVGLYFAFGFAATASVPDFYGPGQDRLILDLEMTGRG
ncbi:MAG: GNAT family N-acetyltransferase [Terriglobia bacterium]